MQSKDISNKALSPSNTKSNEWRCFILVWLESVKKNFLSFMFQKRVLLSTPLYKVIVSFWIKCFNFEILKQFCVLKADKSHFLSSVDVI